MLSLPSAITDVAQVRGFGEHVHVSALVAGPRVVVETEATLPESWQGVGSDGATADSHFSRSTSTNARTHTCISMHPSGLTGTLNIYLTNHQYLSHQSPTPIAPITNTYLTNHQCLSHQSPTPISPMSRGSVWAPNTVRAIEMCAADGKWICVGWVGEWVSVVLVGE